MYGKSSFAIQGALGSSHVEGGLTVLPVIIRPPWYAYLVVTSLNVGVCDNAIIAACCAEIAISAMLIDNAPPTDTFEAFAYTQQELLLNTILLDDDVFKNTVLLYASSPIPPPQFTVIVVPEYGHKVTEKHE